MPKRSSARYKTRPNQHASLILQEINFLQSTLGGLGNTGEGMPGALTPGCRVKVMKKFWEIIGRGFEFVDVGANSGVMLFTARGMGAALAVGLELQDECGPGTVYSTFCEAGRRHGFAGETVANHFSTVVGPERKGKEQAKSLPSLQSADSMLPVGVYSFCDGVPDADRQHMFQLVATNSNVRALMCSPGKARGDPFSTKEMILRALNQAAQAADTRLFAWHSQLSVTMEGGTGKTVHFFHRAHELKW